MIPANLRLDRKVAKPAARQRWQIRSNRNDPLAPALPAGAFFVANGARLLFPLRLAKRATLRTAPPAPLAAKLA